MSGWGTRAALRCGFPGPGPGPGPGLGTGTVRFGSGSLVRLGLGGLYLPETDTAALTIGARHQHQL
ncbi:hypothetical protein ACFWJW_20690 [Streptomyces sp. NPDC127097]|uniref:hypothetical protein n=1 Tax=Streptomyces sp. NPDC127097 TaxID=3347136 RepID=UPI0036632D46